MTLLVGILATDGVVIASDRAVTFGEGPGRFTIADSQKKVEIVSNKVIVVSTGQVGLGQRFRAVVDAAWSAKSMSGTAVQAGRTLAQNTMADFVATQATRGALGALVAFGNSNGHHLIQFASSDFQPELCTRSLPYVSMGSGQSLADPYLALMRRSVWKDTQPCLADATFTAYWVMRQAIAAAPGFIAEPIDIAVLRKKPSGEYDAQLLEDGEIEEHVNRAEQANEKLAEALRGVTNVNVPPPPSPPQNMSDPATK